MEPLLLLCCAHHWEARPFLEALELRPQDRAYSPYQEFEAPGAALLLTGSGLDRAGQAVASYLSRLFFAHQWKTGAGLVGPAVLVGNFGTAGAQNWTPGQSLLVHKLLDPTAQFSLYPELHLKSPWPEAECRSLLTPATSAEGLGDQLVDMEAYGVGSATLSFLSNSHLLVGKFVLDNPAPEPDWRQLTELHTENYRQAALQFLELAQAHLKFLHQDPRRSKALRAQAWSQQRLSELEQKFGFSLTQRRQLGQNLRAAAASFQDDEAFRTAEKQVNQLISDCEGGTKNANRLVLQQLQALLTPSL